MSDLDGTAVPPTARPGDSSGRLLEAVARSEHVAGLLLGNLPFGAVRVNLVYATRMD